MFVFEAGERGKGGMVGCWEKRSPWERGGWDCEEGLLVGRREDCEPNSRIK